ncbi:group 3 secretory phospholipase A2 [Macrotis lagotis]|uniref:group 3 secretory phospholipase A2 n=1 Tax=Macrotis lagotis TaxID=92651 RepID=UPI003D69C5DA
MDHPGWLLWTLVPLGMMLAKGEPGPRFNWNNTFCHLAVPRKVPASPLHSLSFLSLGTDGLVLFHTSWNEQGHLLECVYWQEAPIVLSYQAACAQERGGEPSPGMVAHPPRPLLRGLLGALQKQQDVCGRTEKEPPRWGKEEIKGRAQGEEVLRRVRRGWTMPGTLWCGVGDSAANSSDLGLFQGPDLCCRDHDLCEKNIAPLEYNYGIRNYRFHTISHCDCDSRFRGCLQSQQDTISDFVGTTFFNLLEIPCFVLEEKEACIEWYWWGGCKKYGPISQARLLQQNHYNVTRGESKSSKRKQQRQRNRMQSIGSKGPKGPKRHKSFFRPTPPMPGSSQNANISVQPSSPTLPGLTPSEVITSEKQARVAGYNYTKGRPRSRGYRPGGRQAARDPTEGAAQGTPETPAPDDAGLKPTLHLVEKKVYQDFSKTCQCYRQLDQCPHKIEPGETKYQLYNSENHTLFHCNCTRRMAKVLRTQSSNEVEDKLWNLLALTCFELRLPEDCGPSDGCRDAPWAVVVPARHLRRLWKKQPGWPGRIKGKTVEKRMRRRTRERRLRASGRQQELRGAMSLYDKCREMVSAVHWSPQ